MRALSSGELNRRIGWLFLIAALACDIWLQPWSFSERNPASLADGVRAAAMNAQMVALVMAFVQLAIAEVLTVANPLSARPRNLIGLIVAGAAIIAAGYATGFRYPPAAWLIPAGTLTSLIGLVAFIKFTRLRDDPDLTAIVLVLSFGMLLVGIMGMFELRPEIFLPAYLGPEDGFRLRMLRLARIAFIALSVLTLLYQDLAKRADPESPVVRWGRFGMLCGTIGMPSLLAGAGFSLVELKVLLPIPAYGMLAGTLCGALLAKRAGRSLERWGWLLIALGMIAGLVMGLYAFEVPFSPLGFVSVYNGYARRLIRLAHIDSIVFGFTTIFVARELAREKQAKWSQRLSVALLITGSATSIVVPFLLIQTNLPVSLMSIGPGLVTAAVVFVKCPRLRQHCRGSSVTRELAGATQ